jgi:putative transposase
MVRLTRTMRHLAQSAVMLCTLLSNAVGFLQRCLCSPAALAAENLFLRKQLALYQARHVKPQRVTDGTRCTLVWLSHWFDWPSALVIVQPETFQRWRRQGWHLWWHGPSCPGRPPIPVELQALIRQMARENLTWGQRRIANELRLKLGLRVSPRAVRKALSYMDPPATSRGS